MDGKKQKAPNEIVHRKSVRLQNKVEAQKRNWEERKRRRKLKEEEQRKRCEAAFKTEEEEPDDINSQYLTVTSDWRLLEASTPVKKEEPEDDNGVISLEGDDDDSKTGQADAIVEEQHNLDGSDNQRVLDVEIGRSEKTGGSNRTLEGYMAMANDLGEIIKAKDQQLTCYQAQIEDLKKEPSREQAEQKNALIKELNDQLKLKDLKIMELTEMIKILEDLQTSGCDGDKTTTRGNACVSASSSPSGSSDSNGESENSIFQRDIFTSTGAIVSASPLPKDASAKVTSKTDSGGLTGMTGTSSKRSKQKERQCLGPKSSEGGLPPNYRRTRSQNMEFVSVRNGAGDAQKPSGSTQMPRLQSINGIHPNDEKGDGVKSPGTRAHIMKEGSSQDFESTNQEVTKRRSRGRRSPSSSRKRGRSSKTLKTATRKSVKRKIGIPRWKKLLHKCDVCGKIFSDKSNLVRHMRTHTGEKPFECNICNAKFARKYHLKTHRRMHTGEKPFECDICPHRCTTASDLKRHKRTHTGEKPYNCDICHKKFARASDLRKHQRTHTGEKPFECQTCHEKFSQSSNLKTHQRIHTGERPFKCEICHKQFTHKGNLQDHVRRVH